jgi:hypothetical protein
VFSRKISVKLARAKTADGTKTDRVPVSFPEDPAIYRLADSSFSAKMLEMIRFGDEGRPEAGDENNQGDHDANSFCDQGLRM